MAKEKNAFIFESYQDKNTVIKYLKALKDGFENNEIILNTSGKDLVLCPGDLIKMEIRSDASGNTERLELSFSWKGPGKN